jgi:hypothetical protein
LGSIGSPAREAVPALGTALSDNSFVQKAVRKALEQIGDNTMANKAKNGSKLNWR